MYEVDQLIDEKFQVLGVLGSGFFGTVYRAEQSDLGRMVAVKVLQSEAALSQDARARFEREARVLASLEHENIIRVLGCGLADGSAPYLYMEYVEGKTLDRILEEGALAEPRIGPIAIQICRALAVAHRSGIVHRDLSPRNIMLCEQDELVKVLDFGLAAMMPDSEWTIQKVTRTGQAVGTVNYMSPEAVSGTKVDPRSDIYSLGCVLYQLAAGKPPFEGAPYEVMRRQFVEMPPRLVPNANVSPGFELIIFKALQKNPDNRFQSAEEFEEALTLLQQGRVDDLRLSPALLGGTKTNRGPAVDPLFAAVVGLCVLSVVGLSLVFVPQAGRDDRREEADKAAATRGLSRADERRNFDVRRAQECLDLAVAAKGKGDIGAADAKVRQALDVIGHKYPEEVLNRQSAMDDLAILKRATEVYEGSKSGTIKPFPGISNLLVGELESRDHKLLDAEKKREFYLYQAGLSAAYGDYPLAATSYSHNVENALHEGSVSEARKLVTKAEQMLGAHVESSVTRYRLATMNGMVALAEGQQAAARRFAEVAWKASEERDFTTDFFALLPLLQLEQQCGDKAGATRVFDRIESLAVSRDKGGSIVADEGRLRYWRGFVTDQSLVERLEKHIEDVTK